MNHNESTANLRQPPERASLVSVVVPTYNRATLLRAAITSVLCQSWLDLEVVVVDDGSSDQTRAVVSEMAEEDDRVRYFHRPNGGVSAARNTALSKCRGGLIAFLDSDDAWHPWKLKSQVGVLNAIPEVGMVWSDMNAVDPDGELICSNYLRKMYKGYQRLESGDLFGHSSTVQQLVPDADAEAREAMVSWGHIYSNMLFGNLVHTSTVVLRRERAAQVGAFDESMKHGGEDYKFHLATTRLGAVAFLNASTIKYRVGAADQITNAKNQVHFAAAFLKTLEDELRTHREELRLSGRGIAGIRADAHDWLAWALEEAGERRQAASHAIQAIGQRVITPTAWKTLAKTLLPRNAIELVRAARKLRLGSTSATM